MMISPSDMETMTAQSVISLCPSTKEQIEIFANQLIDDVEQGVTNPLALHIRLTLIEKSFDKVKEAIKKQVVTEAEKHNQKSFDHMGCKIEVKEMGVKYDYSGCNDAEWNSLNEGKKAYEVGIKERQEFLKALKKKETIVNEETGEIIEIFPPIKISTTSIAVTPK